MGSQTNFGFFGFFGVEPPPCLAQNAELERTRWALLPLKNNYKELPQRELATPVLDGPGLY